MICCYFSFTILRVADLACQLEMRFLPNSLFHRLKGKNRELKQLSRSWGLPWRYRGFLWGRECIVFPLCLIDVAVGALLSSFKFSFHLCFSSLELVETDAVVVVVDDDVFKLLESEMW